MPFNTNPIPPPEEITGQSSLPLTRVKRTIQADEESLPCLPGSTFLISICTELFIQYLAEQGHKVKQAESKPQRNIQYRDLSNAVARVDNLQFLSDVVPRTITYKDAKARGAQGPRARSPRGRKIAEDKVAKNRMRLSFGKTTARLASGSQGESAGHHDSMVDDNETEDDERMHDAQDIARHDEPTDSFFQHDTPMDVSTETSHPSNGEAPTSIIMDARTKPDASQEEQANV